MTRLKTRLAKLENASKPAQNWDFSVVLSCARKKLTPEDLNLVDEAYVIGNTKWTEEHIAAWKTWDAAVGEATAEVNFQVRLGGDDLLL
jgi:hypothetical protein